MARTRQLVGVLGSAGRNPTLLRVGLGYAAFIGVETGAWVVLLVYAYQSGGTSAAAAIALVQLLPSVVLAPWIGSLADRRRPGRVLCGGYVVLAVSIAGVAALMAAGGPRALVYLLASAVNLTLCAARPAQAALLPSIVTSPEELAAANAGQAWLESVSTLLVPIVVALLLAAGPTALAMACMAGLAAAAALLVVGIPGLPPLGADVVEGSDGAGAGVVAGLRSIVRQPAARTLVLVLAAQYVLVGVLDLIFVVLAISVLDLGSAGAGYLTAAFGVGGFLAVAVTTALVGRRRLAPALIASASVAIAALIILGVYETRASAFLLTVLAGVAVSVFDVTGRTLLQRTISSDLLASVFGALESLMCAGLAVGFVLAPLLIALGGAEAALVGTGAVLLGLLVWVYSRLRSVDSSASVPVVEIHLLRSIDMFGALPAPTLETLARAVERVRVTAGTTIMHQGDAGDRYYAIASGVLDVTCDGVAIASLSRGEGVGEIALIQATPRTATVTAQSDAEVYALDREPFLLAVTGHASVRTSADGVMRRRLEELAASRPGG
ncbi:MAG TPA: MFS transporter [Solirubrobacteraceae bacterium]|nr:MFS transporter [Solirubrobacteraceae bacterium]